MEIPDNCNDEEMTDQENDDKDAGKDQTKEKIDEIMEDETKEKIDEIMEDEAKKQDDQIMEQNLTINERFSTS